MKVTVIGAGNVGATVANVIVQKNFAGEVVLLDIREGYAEGKAMDMNQASTILGSFTKVTGADGTGLHQPLAADDDLLHGAAVGERGAVPK